MSISQAVRRRIENIWSHGDEEEYGPEDHEASESGADRENYSRDTKYSSSYSAPQHGPTYGGGSANSARRLRPVATPLRSREKNIYTLKPKNHDEAAIAADYLKTGSAVVLNLEEVDRVNAVRIIDFMSGVCYGLDNQGHAMKLGDTIFLFTPGEFEISSDEADYGENPEYFFNDVALAAAASSAGNAAAVLNARQSASLPDASNAGLKPPSFPTVERRAWER